MARRRDGEKLVRAVELRGLGHSQEEVAEILGVSSRTIRRWEKGIANGEIQPLDSLQGAAWAAYHQSRSCATRAKILSSLIDATASEIHLRFGSLNSVLDTVQRHR